MNILIDDYVIVCVSELRREKAHTNLLEAVSKLEHRRNLMPQIVLVGDGAERIGNSIASAWPGASRNGLESLRMSGQGAVHHP